MNYFLVGQIVNPASSIYSYHNRIENPTSEVFLNQRMAFDQIKQLIPAIKDTDIGSQVQGRTRKAKLCNIVVISS